MRNGTHKIKKGYLKIHVAVDIKTKEIIALEVTDEKVHDNKMLKKLINHVLDNQGKKKIKSVLADGTYDSNKNFRYLEKKEIVPGIKVRKTLLFLLKIIL
jgi:DDE family transposase